MCTIFAYLCPGTAIQRRPPQIHGNHMSGEDVGIPRQPTAANIRHSCRLPPTRLTSRNRKESQHNNFTNTFGTAGNDPTVANRHCR